jgi:hypothetical protein
MSPGSSGTTNSSEAEETFLYGLYLFKQSEVHKEKQLMP